MTEQHGERVNTSHRPFGALSIRTRMALTSGLTCAFVAVVLALGLYVVSQQFVQSAQLARLSSAALLMESRVVNSLIFGQYDPGALTRRDVPADIQVRVSQGDSVLIVSQQFPATLPLDVQPGVYRLGSSYVLSQIIAARGVPVLLTLTLSGQAADAARYAFLRAGLIILPGVLLLACLAAWWAAGRMLRPLSRLEQEARVIGESGDLTRPLTGVGGGDELGRLAATLQASFRQLDATRSREVQFLRSAAHDLRGPLSALRTRVALSLSRDRAPERYRADLLEVGEDLSRLSTLAEHLLLLARNPGNVNRQPVNLLDVAADAVDTARSRDPDTELDVRGDPVTVQGDRVLLGQALGNLLGNAARYAPGAGVDVTVGRQGEWAVLSVHDDGPGVDPAELPRLGEAFYRPDQARSADGGHGLGLAIVRHVAALHGGTLELESAAGQGFTARLRLPLAQDAASGLMKAAES